MPFFIGFCRLWPTGAE